MVKESFTSYNRQIRQLEANLAALPANNARRANLNTRLRALRASKAQANARKAAIISGLKTTGKGLAAVAAAPFYGLYKGTEYGVRAGKARYASYTSEQERRRELNQIIRGLVKLNNLNAEIQGIPQQYTGNSYFLNAYRKLKKEKIYKLAQRYANQGGEPPPTQPNVKLIYNQIMSSKARKAAVVSGLKTAGKKLAAGAAAPFVATGDALSGAGRSVDAKYKAYIEERKRKLRINAQARQMVEDYESPPRNNANANLKAAFRKYRSIKAKKLAQELFKQGADIRGQPQNVKQFYRELEGQKKRRNARKAAVVSGVKRVGSGLGTIAAKALVGGYRGLEKTGSYIQKMKTKSMQNYENEISKLNLRLQNINRQLQNQTRTNENKENLRRSRRAVSEKRDELEKLLRRLQVSKTGRLGLLGKIYQRTQEYESQKAGLASNLEKVEKELANPQQNLSPDNRNKLEKRQREIKVRMAELNRLILKRNRPPQRPPPPPPPTFGAAPQPTPRSGLAPALSTRGGVLVNRMSNFAIKYDEATDERVRIQIIQQAYKVASDNMKKARTDTELEEMYSQYRTLGPDSRRFKDLLDMAYKSIKTRLKSKRENRGNAGKLFGGGNLSKYLGSESTRKILQELPTAQREAVKNAGGIARASSLIENAGGPTVVTRAAEVLKKSGGNVERAALNTPNIPVRAFQNVKKLGGPSTAVRTVRVVQVVKTRVRRRKTPVKKPRRVPTRKTKKKKKTSVATLKKIVHKLPRRNLEREALKWLSR
jgi:hypothetical protein